MATDSDQVFDAIDWQCMRMSLEEAARSHVENQREPRVGAVARLANGEIFAAHRSQEAHGEHAEFTLIHRMLGSSARLEGATVYTTLEPCTTGARGHGKQPCAEWIARSGVRRVVIGLLDPNPSICGRGYWRLLEAGKIVDCFPWLLAEQIRELNVPFVSIYRSPRSADTTFEEWVQGHKAPDLVPLPGFGFGVALELQSAPSPQEGWLCHQVTLFADDDDPFVIPSEHEAAFQNYFRDNFDRKRFADDGEKFMVATNPVSFEEAPTLSIRLRPTRYSAQHFYRDVIAKYPAEHSGFIRELMMDGLTARFPHSASLQVTLVTGDLQVLLTERSRKTGVYQNLWSPSFEEDLRREDLLQDTKDADVLSKWTRRALREELKLNADELGIVDVRLLSVFLECDCLNVSFCTYCSLSATADEITKSLQVKRGDLEFRSWGYLPLSRSDILREVARPSRQYHPSGQYRLLMTYLKLYGYPSITELRDAG